MTLGPMNNVKLTEEQLGILQHSLGLDKYGRGTPYRNYFCAGDADEPICGELVGLGLMKRHVWTETYPYYNCSVTEEGKRIVREQSPPPPKVSRSQKRYQDYLDADSGMKFGEWIRRKS